VFFRTPHVAVCHFRQVGTKNVKTWTITPTFGGLTPPQFGGPGRTWYILGKIIVQKKNLVLNSGGPGANLVQIPSNSSAHFCQNCFRWPLFRQAHPPRSLGPQTPQNVGDKVLFRMPPPPRPEIAHMGGNWPSRGEIGPLGGKMALFRSNPGKTRKIANLCQIYSYFFVFFGFFRQISKKGVYQPKNPDLRVISPIFPGFFGFFWVFLGFFGFFRVFSGFRQKRLQP